MDYAIRELTTADVIRMAREQAEAGLSMQHDFEPGTTQAAAFERTYIERARQLDEHDDE
ncbi:hypothetical protein [Ramlibacter sp.]|uniref:hypothetical protein n=1 Tax=Ramlibacter sp. TaxID=1917967 RepID=UPI003D14CE37